MCCGGPPRDVEIRPSRSSETHAHVQRNGTVVSVSCSSVEGSIVEQVGVSPTDLQRERIGRWHLSDLLANGQSEGLK
jgi:hypothetical protein